MMSWLISNSIKSGVRERTIITFSGLSPDIDSFGLVVDLIGRLFGHQSHYWSEYHRSLHNLGFCLAITILAFFVAKADRFKVAGISFLAFHLHLLCDLIGSKSPDGYQWPINYLQPFSDSTLLVWQYQWEFNAWPNLVIGCTLIAFILCYAQQKQRSPFEIISAQADQVFLNLIKNFSNKKN